MTLALESYDGDDGVGVDEDDEGVRPAAWEERTAWKKQRLRQSSWESHWTEIEKMTSMRETKATRSFWRESGWMTL